MLRRYEDGSFAAPAGQPYVVGGGPQSVAFGAFNPGGTEGLVAANSEDNTVSVLLANGDGAFQPATAYAVGPAPVAVATGDFNTDGNVDILTADQGRSSVTVLLSRGGVFLPPHTYPAGDGAGVMVAGDFNGDGSPDLAVNNAGKVSVLIGNGDGSFLPPVSYPVGSVSTAIVAADLTGDGALDLLTANEGDGTVSVLLGQGDGTFVPDPYGPDPGGAFPVGPEPFDVAVGHFTSSGNADIVVANISDGRISVLLGDGQGGFIPDPNSPLPGGGFPVGVFPEFVTVADLNGDGYSDIIIPNAGDGTLSVLLGNGDGTFQPQTVYLADPGARDAAAGDFDGDGYPDLVTANFGNGIDAGSVSVYLNNGDGTFRPPVEYAVGAGPEPVTVGDFLRNGILDIATVNIDGTVSVLFGRGDGSFSPALTVPLGHVPDGMAVADLNGDGRLDLAYTNNQADTISVQLGGQFEPTTAANGVGLRDAPSLRDLTGARDRHGGLVPDEVALDNSGRILSGAAFPTSPVGSSRPSSSTRTTRRGTPRCTRRGRAPGRWPPSMTPGTSPRSTPGTPAPTAARGAFRRTVGFPTGNLPVRIAAGDLTGDGLLDSLVVANGFDNTVTVALPGAIGVPFVVGDTNAYFTVPVGAGPSDITFLTVAGRPGAEVVVSGQVAGDFTVLTDYTQGFRYRAGAGLFGTDDSAGPQAGLSALQTVAVAAADFTRPGNTDLVTLNRGAGSFTLLPGLGDGRFGDPEPANTYYFGAGQASQVVPVTLPGDTLPGVAVLMDDLAQIWFYRNNGDGTFAAPVKIDAGNDPTGFSVTTVNGRPALLVGNSFGDVLTLLYDGHGGFAPDPANLQGAPLAVGTVAATGQHYAVVANQQLNQVWLYSVVPGTGRFGSPVQLSAGQQLPLLAPGAVQTFSVPGDPNQYLAVADSLSNNILLYQYDLRPEGPYAPPAGGSPFRLVNRYDVGDDPVSITVGHINGDNVPDLAVANEGSNDVSILIGDTSTGVWAPTSYQRVGSGGIGPVGVSMVAQPGSGHGPDLLTTNADGTLAEVPGIGSGGAGSGFFATPQTRTATLPGVPLGPVSGGLVGTSSGLFRFDVATVATVLAFPATGLTAFFVGANGDVLAGFAGGAVDLLTPQDDGQLAADLVFRDAELTDPSALALDSLGGQPTILATNVGQGSLFVFTLSEGIAVPGTGSPFQSRGAAPEVQAVDGAGLFLVAALVTDVGTAPSGGDVAAAGGFGVGVGPLTPDALAAVLIAVINGGDNNGLGDDNDANPPPAPAPSAEPSAAPLNDFISGVDEAIRTFDPSRPRRGDPGAAVPANPAPESMRPQGMGDGADSASVRDDRPQFPDVWGDEIAGAVADATALLTWPARHSADAVFTTDLMPWDGDRALLLAMTVVGSVAAPLPARTRVSDPGRRTSPPPRCVRR